MAMRLDRALRGTPRFPAAAVSPRPPTTSSLRRRYGEYCQRQAVGLMELVPREAVRPLYRRAREWAMEQGLHESKDPMATLHRFCRELLPLPPFDDWLVDYEAHRLAHLKAGVRYPNRGEPSEVVTVELREVEHASSRWQASLDVYRDEDVWRGYIRFHRSSTEANVRTGDIFCDEELQDLRDRFLSFTTATLAAFLRSILP